MTILRCNIGTKGKSGDVRDALARDANLSHLVTDVSYQRGGVCEITVHNLGKQARSQLEATLRALGAQALQWATQAL